MAKTGFYVEGVEEMPIENENEFANYFRKGVLSRLTRPTKVN